MKPENRHTVLIIPERAEGADPFAIARELAACARHIAEAPPGEQIIVWNDTGEGDDIESLSRDAGCTVIAFDGGIHPRYSCETSTREFASLALELSASFILIPHTARGYDFAPRLAVRLDAKCITSVEGAEREGDNLRFTRSTCFGKLNASISPGKPPVVITVMPGAFRPEVRNAGTKPVTARRVVSGSDVWTRAASLRVSPGAMKDFANADVIVSAGKGMQKQENIALVRELAERFPRSAVGGSRIACDLGWLGYDAQIGITGKSVAPKLYVACGISGAFQHVSAIRGARYIVAINRDPCAAIFREADIGVVDDAVSFIPLLLGEIDAGKRKA